MNELQYYEAWLLEATPLFLSCDHVLLFSLKRIFSQSTHIQTVLHTVFTYTVHWASKETYHFFRTTLTKILSIKMNHWTQISLSTSKNKWLFGLKKAKIQWNHKRSLKKITKSARLLSWEFPTDKSKYSGYITRHWNWMNSYWMFWIGCLHGACLVKLLISGISAPGSPC